MRPTDRQAPVQEEPCLRDGHIGIAVVHQLVGLRLQAVQGPQKAVFLIFFLFVSRDFGQRTRALKQ